MTEADQISSSGKHGKGVLSALDRETGEIRLIHQVARGKACGCICAACGAPVVARHGESRKVSHHFAHAAGSSVETRICRETALHNAAKRLLATSLSGFAVPRYVLEKPTLSFALPERRTVSFRETLVQAQHTDRLDGQVEPRDTPIAPLQPDAWVDTSIGRIHIEIWVTHRTEQEKAASYKVAGLAALEIDLSSYAARGTSLEDLTQLLTHKAPRHWLSFPHPPQVAEKLLNYEDQASRLRKAEAAAIIADLTKGDLSAWEPFEFVHLDELKYQNESISINTSIYLRKVYRVQGYWLCDALSMSSVPIFVDPDPIALEDIRRRYRRQRRKDMTAFVLANGRLTLYLPTPEKMVWTLYQLFKDSEPFDCFEVSKVSLEDLDDASSLPIHSPTSCWVVPSLTERNTPESETVLVRKGLSRELVRALITHTTLHLIVSNDEDGAFAMCRRDRAESFGAVVDGNELYGQLREGLARGTPPRCFLSMGLSGRNSEDRQDITAQLVMHDGALYFEVSGLGPIPILLDRDVHLVAGIEEGFLDDSQLFDPRLCFKPTTALLNRLESGPARDQVLRHVVASHRQQLKTYATAQLMSCLKYHGVSHERAAEAVTPLLQDATLEVGADCDLEVSLPAPGAIAKFNLQNLFQLSMAASLPESGARLNLINEQHLSAKILAFLGADKVPALDTAVIKHQVIGWLMGVIERKHAIRSASPSLETALHEEIEIEAGPPPVIKLGTMLCALNRVPQVLSRQCPYIETDQVDAVGRQIGLQPVPEEWQLILEGVETLDGLLR